MNQIAPGPLRSSVIITTYNRPDALRVVLLSLARQSVQNFEVLVADDGSVPATAQVLAELALHYPLPLRHVWQADKGFRAARARNGAAMAARSDHLIFLDGDCVCPPQFVQRHRELLAAAGPMSFVNGSRVLLTPAATQAVIEGRWHLQAFAFWRLLYWRLLGRSNKLPLDAPWLPLRQRLQTDFEWKRIRSCNFSLSKALFTQVNGFDESFEGWGHEDADLVLRLHHADGIRVNGFWATEVWHLWHPERSRGQESQNYQRVMERQHSGQIKASVGLLEHQPESDEWVRDLNAHTG
jgi:glycosyltransferase involved in cell wall biosynthesis